MTNTVRREAGKEHSRWLRRQAVHLVAQLPENEDDALQVLSHARALILQFIGEDAAGREFRALRLIQQADESD